jgi:membrane associated rhomboid family serine protease
VITILLIAVNVVVYFFVQPQYRGGNDEQFTYAHAAIPCEVVQGRPLTVDEVAATVRGGDANACQSGPLASPPEFPGKQVFLAVLYSMFLHASLLHIGGNMLFLWVFGNNIEDVMGAVPYLLFYLLAGLVAAATDIATQPSSTVPIVGASGAIAGVMGAYLVLFPNVRIRTIIVFYLFFIRDISAKWLLLFWFALQFFTSPSSGVAWVAHVGGFVFGAIVGILFRERLRRRRLAF